MQRTPPTGEPPHMTDYGVGGDGWSPLPWAWAGERLARTRNYWVVTVGADGQPHSMPVWGVWHADELRFVFSCSPNAKKARNVATNPKVTVTNDDSVECVSMQGSASLVTDPDRIETWVQRYVAKYGDEVGPDFADFMRAHAVVEVVPTVAFAIIERADEFATRATRWRFD